MKIFEFVQSQITDLICISYFRQWKLCREIDAYIDNFEKSSNHLHYSLKIPDPGEYCLVKQEEEFYRGKVIDFTYDETDKMKVFLVDIGETIETDMDNVYNIPERLLKTLPFQVSNRIFPLLV